METEVSTSMELDLCIPTWNSGNVLEKSIEHFYTSLNQSPVTLSTMYILDNNSTDDTIEVARRCAHNYNWEIEVICEDCNLAEARETATSVSDADWLFFLDDDVHIRNDYISTLVEAVSPLTGAVQGKKVVNDSKHNSNWVRWRSHRSGTHATLIRREAVTDIEIPKEIVVLEDEYIRKYIEKEGWLWIYNHQAVFTHNNMKRHPASWTQGLVAGKYDLMSFSLVLRTVLAAFIQGDVREIFRNLKQLAGWLAGWKQVNRLPRGHCLV
ncbi:glycosyltransferase family 2 protein [Halorubrum ezzemoulense]|uniref:glycosyltransferase family 2 protein n=1 Tax=Halorubrum ezzemoulense TaxID=337243 RepID=UPI0023310C92|nr:glycosyltransferase [Halorubrum ezzemoulense]MDB2243108.1 glycosyltransferase [Halorubrum ezzemoulense]